LRNTTDYPYLPTVAATRTAVLAPLLRFLLCRLHLVCYYPLDNLRGHHVTPGALPPTVTAHLILRVPALDTVLRYVTIAPLRNFRSEPARSAAVLGRYLDLAV